MALVQTTVALYAAVVDISALPAGLQKTARIDANGEVSWPDGNATPLTG